MTADRLTRLLGWLCLLLPVLIWGLSLVTGGWLLLPFLFLVWGLSLVAGGAYRSVEQLLRTGEDKTVGVSITPLIPVFPLAFWGVAKLVDLGAAPWGTLIVGWFHAVLLIGCVGSIGRSYWRGKRYLRLRPPPAPPGSPPAKRAT
jgi:hypothetical protein